MALVVIASSANAQLAGSCDGSCVPKLFYNFNKALNQLNELQITPIGQATQQLIESNDAGHLATGTATVETSQIKVTERHELAKKVNTLHIKQRIDAQYGSIADEIAILTDVEGSLNGQGSISQLTDTMLVNNKLLSAETTSSGLRTRVLAELPPTTPQMLDSLNTGKTIDKGLAEGYGLLVKVLTEKDWFPAPHLEANDPRSLQYRSLYNERAQQLEIPQSFAYEYVAQRLGAIEDADVVDYFNTLLASAGVPSDEGAISQYRTIQALALTQFGSGNAPQIAGVSGEELERKMVHQLAINTYLRSRLTEEQRKIKQLQGLMHSFSITDKTNKELKESLLSTPR